MEKQSGNFFSVVGVIGCITSILIILVLCACMSIFVVLFAESSNLAIKQAYKENVLSQGSSGDKVGLIKVEGIIWDMEDGVYEKGLTTYILESLDTILDDKDYKVLIIQIDSPGGSLYDSARITDKILELKERGVVIVSYMESIGASGGYWVAAPSDAIYLQPETFTGSIGIFVQTYDYEKLLDMIGIKEIYITNKEGTQKVPDDYDDPESQNYKIIQEILDENYEEFISLIQDGRGLTRGQLEGLVDGRVISGRQAVENGLADGFGGYDEALSFGIEKAELDDPKVIEFQRSEILGFGSWTAKLNVLYTTLRPQEPKMSLVALPEKGNY